MSEWQEVKLENIAEVQTGPFGSHLKNEQYIIGGTPVITVEHITNFTIENISYPSVLEEDRLRLNRYSLAEGDIVFSRVGSVDLSAYVKKENDGWLFSSRMLRVRPNLDLINGKFLSYFFRQKNFREHIYSIAVGATMPSINTEILKNINIRFPPLPEQQAIASVLSSLDDKIDLLHRQNKTLEAMAETLFRQWFIEEAKDDCDEKELGELCEIITKGTTPKQFSDLGINFIKAESISNDGSFIFSKFSKVSEGIHIGFLKRSILKENDLLFSIAGTIGRVAKVTKNLLPANTNQALAILRPKDNINPNLIYCILKSDFFQNLSESKIVHAVQPNLSLGEISKTLISLPSEQKIKDFNQIINPIFDKKLFNSNQIQTLENLRDTLLPKLMSGEIRVQH